MATTIKQMADAIESAGGAARIRERYMHPDLVERDGRVYVTSALAPIDGEVTVMTLDEDTLPELEQAESARDGVAGLLAVWFPETPRE